MLNKGPFLLETVSILDEVLVEMEAHQWKKMSTFRALHWVCWARRNESSDRYPVAGKGAKEKYALSN